MYIFLFHRPWLAAASEDRQAEQEQVQRQERFGLWIIVAGVLSLGLGGVGRSDLWEEN